MGSGKPVGVNTPLTAEQKSLLARNAPPGAKAGTVRLAGNAPVAPQIPTSKDFDQYRQIKEQIAAAKPGAAPVASTPTRQGITMGPGTASRSF